MIHCLKPLCAAAAAVSVLVSTQSFAATITSGNVPQAGGENVLFNGAGLMGTGTTVQGRTNQSDFVVDFTSSSWLQTPAGGQAKIDAGKKRSFTDLSISLNDVEASFTSLIFNLGAKQNGSAGVTVFGMDGEVLLSEAVSLSKNGNNFMTIVAGEQEYFSRVLISGSVAFSSASQFRIGGVGFDSLRQATTEFEPEITSAAVPAPGAAWGGAGLLGLYAAGVVRSRRARLSEVRVR